MLKVYLKLMAKQDTPEWKKGEFCELLNDVFDEKNGIAYYSISPNWEIVKMEIREYAPIVV